MTEITLNEKYSIILRDDSGKKKFFLEGTSFRKRHKHLKIKKNHWKSVSTM